MVWETFDPEIISGILEHFNGLQGNLIQGGAGGGSYVRIQIFMKNNEIPVTVSVSALSLYHGVTALPDDGGITVSLKVTGGAKTEDEWEAILDRCDRIQ
jgi:hypothetical protein